MLSPHLYVLPSLTLKRLQIFSRNSVQIRLCESARGVISFTFLTELYHQAHQPFKQSSLNRRNPYLFSDMVYLMVSAPYMKQRYFHEIWYKH